MSSGFVSETELKEKRKLRQEEWEKVRRPDQPEEVPEEVIDHRCLYDRLEEQKQKKQLEYEEAHKLKNMIKGLDDDEVDFLDFVDQKKLEAEQLKDLEEKREIQEFRRHVERLKETSIEERIQAEIRTTKPVTSTSSSSSLKSQQKLLQGAVVKRKSTTSNGTDVNLKRARDSRSPEGEKLVESKESVETEANTVAKGTSITCVGILPGLANYSPSSDSDSSDSLDEPEHTRTKYDLLGRQLVYESKSESKPNQQTQGHDH